jgi:hypothetical protein
MHTLIAKSYPNYCSSDLEGKRKKGKPAEYI